ncbi:DUF3141 domain-containing protein [Kribbella kalugense]|uniref:Uncharacterized protein DUF3141 n=1 Tax=Kribbella kalugense TaxID=2512221 RepID=A0A4R7ZV40_9ACTN|nr:DUF3141 domain-containing protein [Kribbella kalugense]TDW21923.1 uncharacterized protein DUF3141 [Kribbella kalugense]
MATSHPHAAIVSATVDETFGHFETLVRGASDYFADIVSRHSTPLRVGLDLVSWATTIADREPPRWATENNVVAAWPIARLRDFSTAGSEAAIPLLLLPPQAGHDSCIVDYDPLQSQVRTALDSGLTRVLSMDWIGATAETKDASIEDYVAVVDEAIALAGGRVHLAGDCQGGWLAVIYAALHPETVETLTIAGAPVDFHAGEPLIHDWMQVLSPRRDLAFYRAVVGANGGVLPGRFLLAGFVAMQPANELDRQLQLLAHIGEPAHVNRYRTFENWFRHTQPIPGAFYLWIVERLFQDNELVAGSLQVAGHTVELARIACPVYLLTGKTDRITPPPQVFALADHIGTRPTDIHRRQTTGGHLGLFMGRQALRDHWQPIFAALAARS